MADPGIQNSRASIENPEDSTKLLPVFALFLFSALGTVVFISLSYLFATNQQLLFSTRFLIGSVFGVFSGIFALIYFTNRAKNKALFRAVDSETNREQEATRKLAEAKVSGAFDRWDKK